MDILKTIKEHLAGESIEATFEGANIVLYTENEKFFNQGEPRIKEVVSQDSYPDQMTKGFFKEAGIKIKYIKN